MRFPCIYGLGEWVDANMGLLKFDKETFYKKMLDTYYKAFFIDVTNEGTLEEFLNKCMTKDELIDIVMLKFEQQGM